MSTRDSGDLGTFTQTFKETRASGVGILISPYPKNSGSDGSRDDPGRSEIGLMVKHPLLHRGTQGSLELEGCDESVK